MRVLIVGGAGFIGSHLCEALIKKNHEVVCVDDLSLGTYQNIEHLKANEKFKFYKMNAADEETLYSLFLETNPEYVFHLAANSDIQASAGNPEIEYKNTYSTTFVILSCMAKLKIKKFFFASTSAVYGNKKDIILDENTPNLSPISYYGAAKLGSEALISAFSYMNDMQALVFRFPNVIGPRLTHGVIYDFIHKLNENREKLIILGDGRQTKPYIYVEDLISSILHLMFEVSDGMTVYNIGVRGSTSVTQIADIVCEEMGLQHVQYEYTGGESGWKGDVPEFKYCLDKIHSTGWKARYTSDEAVRETVKNNI